MTIKRFKEFLTEAPTKAPVPSYVVVRNNRVELRKMDSGSPSCTFAVGATTAVLQGNIVVVTLRNGKVVLYKVNSTGTSASGPYAR